jgi:exopolysaccharide biosynthesis polyprenyl glycosylphosphotransferase
VSAVGRVAAASAPVDARLLQVDERTRDLLMQQRANGATRRRGWLVRRMLLLADVFGLSVAFLVADLAFTDGPGSRLHPTSEILVFFLTFPGWIVLAKIYGLYERDEERADHSTVDDLVGVFHLVTVGAWVFFVATWATGAATPNYLKLITFWILSVLLVTAARAAARTWCRTNVSYLQNTIIVGAGEVGQLVARRLLQHPEYGLHLVGFVDAAPLARRNGLGHIAMLGAPRDMPELVRLFDVERVIIAFSSDSDREVMSIVRSLRDLDVQVDVVPRLFEVVGPNVGMHSVEGMQLVGLPPARLSRSSFLIKRGIDIVGALLGLILTAPLFAFIAIRIRLDSPGPILFRQTRLGLNQREFTALKFRTLHVGADTSRHRDYISAIMKPTAESGENGLYKLDYADSVTRPGQWLRRTSLDELPQLLNVLRGDMSLVGPRPCIPYEVENFEEHHFDRFLVPAGITGLWQVTARAASSFGEALDMDVAYVRGWSLGLDLRLLFRTPFVLLRQRRATA